MGFYENFVFPRTMDWMMRGPRFQWERRIALEPAFGDVLELGFGTGLNLPHYPGAVKSLSAIDPSDMLPRRVEERISAARMPVIRGKLRAEKLPYESERFDCVVSTWTLCTIPELDAALREAGRVLKPGGKLIFLEHGRSGDGRLARWQDRINPLQRIFGCGCNMNRDIDAFIRDAGLEIVRLDRFLMPRVPRLLGEMYRGVAQANK